MTKNGRHIVIRGVYAPNDDTEKLIKYNLYDKLSNTLSSIKDNNKIFILGDLNERTGREHNDPVVRKYGEATINDNGKRLRD